MIRRLVLAALLGLGLAQVALAQPSVPLRPGTTLFALNLSGTPIGEFPVAIKQLKGTMEVVRQGGVPMLKASAASEFLITLPQVLPADFTLEFDLVPKRGSNPQDLSFEGTPTINQGVASAHVLWHATGYLGVIGGGGDNYETAMPEDLRATLPGVLTHVVADFQGNTLKLYTNGRRHYTLDKQFARGRVLRVFLGAQDGGTEAVYLAGLRITTGSGLGIVAVQAGLPTGRQPVPSPPSGTTNYVPPVPGTPSPGSQPGGQVPAPSALPAAPPTGSITPSTPPTAPSAPGAPGPSGKISKTTPLGPATMTATSRAGWGVVLRWDEVPPAVGYQVDRSEGGGPFVLLAGVDAIDDPAVGGFFTFEDVTVLPGRSYQYRVFARFASGPASAMSPVASFDAPNGIAQVSNLTASLGNPVQPTAADPFMRSVTWNWTGVPGALTYEAEMEIVLPGPGGNTSLSKTRYSLSASTSPPFSVPVQTGRSVWFCLSLIRPDRTAQSLPYPVCRMTDVP